MRVPIHGGVQLPVSDRGEAKLQSGEGMRT